MERWEAVGRRREGLGIEEGGETASGCKINKLIKERESGEEEEEKTDTGPTHSIKGISTRT